MRNLFAHWILTHHLSVRGRCLLAIALSVVALILTKVFQIQIERNLLFISLAATVLSASLAGYGAGVLATLLTGFALNFWFLGDVRFGHLEALASAQSKEDLVRVSVYLATGLLMSLLGGSLHYAIREMSKARSLAEATLRSRDEFISIVSHELKTPITSLKLQTQLNLRALSRPEIKLDRAAQEAMLRSTAETLGRTERLIRDLQDFSRAVHGKLGIELETVDLSGLAGSVIERLEPELSSANIEFLAEVDSRIEGTLDPLRIEQVLTNLLSNALKYGAGTPIEISVKRCGASALIFVRDHGPGVPDRHKPRLFARFERAATAKGVAGLGLGLYISKQIVELHGGRIWIEDTPGGGATFFVLLPLRPEESSSAALARSS